MSTHSPQPGDTFGRYRLLRRIGAGGMGVVHAAHDSVLDREVALKVIAPHQADNAEHRARFEREAAVMARVDSPHVAAVHDYGDHEGSLFLVTALIAGGDLDQRVRAEGHLAPALAVGLLRDVCTGLAHAHEAGVTHRDVKPSNVLLRPHARGVDAVLCDFGIASMPGLELTRTGAVTGSLSYMAPERHRGEAAGVPGDIYSAGCLLWFALTGSAPYDGTEVEIALGHVESPIPQLPGKDPFARQVNQVLRQSMAKDPARRYRSAQAMRADLEVAAAVAPAVAALPEQTSIRRPLGEVTSAGTRRRTPMLAVTGVSVVVALVLATVVAAGVVRGDRRVAETPLARAGVTAAPESGAASSAPAAEESDPERATEREGRSRKGGKSRPGQSRSGAVAPPTEAGAPDPAGPVTVTAPAQGGGKERPRKEKSPDRGPQPEKGPDKEPEDKQSSTPEPSPSPSEKTYRYTCWNGAQTDDKFACGNPTGETGLRYVFAIPSYCPDHPTQGQTKGVELVFSCRTSYDGATVNVAFHEWDRIATRNSWANRFYPGDGYDWLVGGLRYGKSWRTHKPKMKNGLTWIGMNGYARGPFDVQIRAETKEARTWALGQMRYRSPRQWRGYAN